MDTEYEGCIMFGKIIYITESVAHVENTLKNNDSMDFMNVHVIFEAPIKGY